MANYYIDTSIWLDYYEKRVDRLRPLGDLAYEFFKRISEDTVFYSELLIKELKDYDCSDEEIKEIIAIAANLVFVEISEKQYQEAGRIAKKRNLPIGDVLHAIVARGNNAILVTRDKHFYELKDIVEVKSPELI